MEGMAEGDIKNFYDLEAWKKGHELVLLVYKITESFPKQEMFGLVSQLRRAVVSITSNIAEGFSRRTTKEKIQFYYMSLGSLTETENQLIICRDLGYFASLEYLELNEKLKICQKLTFGLIKYLRG